MTSYRGHDIDLDSMTALEVARMADRIDERYRDMMAKTYRGIWIVGYLVLMLLAQPAVDAIIASGRPVPVASAWTTGGDF